jgi:hypothetical protein
MANGPKTAADIMKGLRMTHRPTLFPS